MYKQNLADLIKILSCTLCLAVIYYSVAWRVISKMGSHAKTGEQYCKQVSIGMRLKKCQVYWQLRWHLAATNMNLMGSFLQEQTVDNSFLFLLIYSIHILIQLRMEIMRTFVPFIFTFLFVLNKENKTAALDYCRQK